MGAEEAYRRWERAHQLAHQRELQLLMEALAGTSISAEARAEVIAARADAAVLLAEMLMEMESRAEQLRAVLRNRRP